MKKLVIAAVALAFLGACQKSAPKEAVIVTYNVGVFSKYGENSMGAVSATIKNSGAVIASLNELDSCNRRHATFQLKDFADTLGGWDYHFARAFGYAGGAYGNGVVSKSPILKRWALTLPKGEGSEQRSMAVVETEDMVFGSVHLDHKSENAQIAQVRLIKDWFTANFKDYAKPVIIAGDLNALPRSTTLEALSQAFEILSIEDNTYSTENPRKCIDYILAFKNAKPVKVLSSWVITKGTEEASDHFPLQVKISWE